jgi:aminomethyltransferase
VDDGIDVEYARLRADRGLIDLGGAGLFEVGGAGALGFLDRVCTRSPGYLLEGRTLTALMLDGAGAVVSEVLVACDGDAYMLEVWPAQRDAAWRHLVAHVGEYDGVDVRDLSDDFAICGVEGPRSHLTVQHFLVTPINELAYKHVTSTEWEGTPLVVSRTGVTAEFGYELRTRRALADTLRERLVDLGALPCRLDAVNVCRLESRFTSIEDESPHPGATPFELGLQSMIDGNHDFLGKDALMEAWHSGQFREPVCFTSPGAPPLGSGDAVRAGSRVIGRVAHARWSPGLRTTIGAAHLDRELAAAGLDLVACGQGGVDVPILTCSAPFVVPTSLGVKQG